jgi:peptidyl-prolyl cis-trans isomerase A (cyclophilin A)
MERANGHGPVAVGARRGVGRAAPSGRRRNFGDHQSHRRDRDHEGCDQGRTLSGGSSEDGRELPPVRGRRHYDDTIFHRVIGRSIIQGGGYTPELQEKPTRKAIPLEASIGLQNVRGTVAMARTASKNSATAQFFINVGTNKDFDRSSDNFGYAVFGHVIEGMEVVDLIAKAQTSRRPPFDDIPILPVIIEKVRRAPPK